MLPTLLQPICAAALADWPAHVLHPALETPVAVAVGDLGADGLADVVVADAANGIGAFRGLGAGTFGPLRRLPAWRGAAGLAIVDLDGDGLADVAATSADGADTVVVFLGVGAGFAPPTPLASPATPAGALHAADLDRDGDPDLAVAIPAPGDGGLAVLTRRWDGGYALAWDVATGAQPAAVGSADLDADGDLDLLSSWSGADRVSWNENLGDGRFGETRPIDLSAAGAGDVAAADLDLDGAPDVVAALRSDRQVRWYRNQGDGQLASGREVVRAPAPDVLEVGDVDGDTVPDLVVVDHNGNVGWMPNNGRGRFSGPLGIAHVEDAADVALADTDGDGDRDIVVVGRALDGMIWFENTVVADADHDGLADAHEGTIGTDPARADTDGGGLPDGEELRFGTSPLDPADDGTADHDGDLASDAEEAAAGTDPRAFDGDADGAPDGAELAAGSDPRSPDSDGDGRSDGQELACGADPLDASAHDDDCDRLSDADEAALGTDPQRPDTDGDGLLDGDELAHGADPRLVDTDGGGRDDGDEVEQGRDPALATDDWPMRLVADDPDAGALAAVDLDADGDLDVAVAFTGTPRVAWFENLGDGSFGAVRALVADAPAPGAILAAEVDGDGLEDLVVSAGFDGLTWFRSGDRLLEERPLGTSNGADVLAAADLDHDGDTDLAAGEHPRLGWSRNYGDGQFAGGPETTFDHPLLAIAADDVDGDGWADTLALLDVSHAVQILRATDPQTFTPRQTLVDEGPVLALATADLDADGDPDVVLGRGGARQDLAWLENRAGALAATPEALAPLDGPPDGVTASDLDGDGDDDLVVATDGGTSALVFSRGAPAFWRVGLERARRVVLADLDGDGARDVLVAGDGGVSWYRNTLPPGADEGPPDAAPDTGDPSLPDDVPAPGPEVSEGCGCRSSPAPASPVALLAFPIALWRRRRRPPPRPGA